ncbi:hypothetical protein BU23DRAFT_630599 [Bimuria novae-zelandiae CBS 107.79]|uniref:Uncharacterized protein n=1 Tax=Bimuria novae-zelandiae CBS 107.79 TaxID=1447943 RepID=A0A6A5UUH1_9PLEO|nr:hypothetical protein BU23DRAFT_630599 [Bimuria novae-zelandiae CBS 107.79]
MADYPTREDFAWNGMQQLSELPKDVHCECPLCKTDLVSKAAADNEDSAQDESSQKEEDSRFIQVRPCSHIYYTTCLRMWLLNPMNKTFPMRLRVLFEASYGSEAANKIAWQKNQIDKLVGVIDLHKNVDELRVQQITGLKEAITKSNEIEGQTREILAYSDTIISNYEKFGKEADASIAGLKEKITTLEADYEGCVEHLADWAFEFPMLCMVAVRVVATLCAWCERDLGGINSFGGLAFNMQIGLKVIIEGRVFKMVKD